MKKNEVNIAEEIIGLAKSIEQERISITFSGLIARKDPFEERRRRVNLILADISALKANFDTSITQTLTLQNN